MSKEKNRRKNVLKSPPQGRRRHQDPRGGKPEKAPKLRIDLFGTHAVCAAWDNPARRIEALYVTEQALKGFAPGTDAATDRPAPTIVDREQMDRALPPGTVHQGIALRCAPLEDVSLQDIIIRTANSPAPLLVMLDQVTDPHNVGAILRSACAFGADGVILQKRHAPELTGVLAKTACGAVEHVPVACETNLTRALETLQDNGFTVIGLDERGDRAIGEIPVQDKTVLVLGAEGPGLRRLVREQCDILVRLPTQGPIASLNVSNAAAVALYALKKATV